jgi:hypothetical protein
MPGGLESVIWPTRRRRPVDHRDRARPPPDRVVLAADAVNVTRKRNGLNCGTYRLGGIGSVVAFASRMAPEGDQGRAGRGHQHSTGLCTHSHATTVLDGIWVRR